MNKKTINKILLLNFVTMAAFNMAHPVTPKLINTLGFPAYMFGVLFSFMAIANFIMSPIWGSFSDQRGRKRFLAIGALGYGMSQVGFGLSTHIGAILLFRSLGGAFAVCFITVAVACITDLTSNKERIKYLSYHTATLSIGSSVGALLGGILGQEDYRYTFIAQGIICIVITAFIIGFIKETTTGNKEKLTIYTAHLKPNTTFIDFKTTIGTMIIVMVLITITTTSYNSTINYYVESVLRLPTTVNGLVMAVSGVIALTMNLVVNPYLGKRFDERRSIGYVTLITGMAIVLASLFNNLIISIGALIIFVAASSLIIPIQQSIVSKLAKENYGEIMGIQGSAKAIGMVIGSLGAGFMFELRNKLPFVFGGVCALLAFVMIVRLNRKNLE